MSNTYELTGKILVLNETQAFASGFTKREFVVETDEKYPQQIKLEAVKEGCDKLDAFNLGDNIKVAFNLRGNEFNGKYYVNLQAWKFDGDGEQKPAQAPPQRLQPPLAATDDALDEDMDDIPF